MQNQRLTIGIRIGAKAPRAPKNRSRAFSPLCGFSPPQFGQGSMLSHCPITCPNRRIPKTLSASFVNTLKIFLKMDKIHIILNVI